MNQHTPIDRRVRKAAAAAGRPRRRGMMIVYLIVILSIIFGLASLAVDYGRVQIAKTQLQIATDAAVKWAAKSATGAKAELHARATDAAGDNKVNGETPVYALADVEIGAWNAVTRTFTANAAPNNAVRLTGTHVVPLMFGGVIQKPFVTIRASAVARRMSTGGMIGLNGITVKNNVFVGSYNSTVTTTPTESTAQGNATISSNGTIQADNNGVIMGSVAYGPSGSVDVKRWTVTGDTTQLRDVVTAPSEPAWSPTGNPGSVPQNYTHPGGQLAGGTYYFTTLNIHGPLTFAGPATVYVNGNVTIEGNSSDVTAYAGRPPNLTIYQLGADRKFTTKNDVAIKATIIAPRSDLEAMNKIAIYGQMVFDTITLMNTATFFYDESGALAQSVQLVQ